MISQKVFVCIIFTLNVIICQKDSDEGRSYEFGFTIDGQQHRHEKKDQNGIIQGEFGFITADGVYHVTVYATDENGNFKILSMKNIRISAPLDGSPALGPISPEASKYLKKPNQIGPVTSKPTPQQFQRIQQATAEVTPPTSNRKNGFTTHSTIRPACAGCGLITPAPPGKKLVFQNPIFNNPTAQVSNLPADTELLPPGFPNQVAPQSGVQITQSYEKMDIFDSPQQNIQSNKLSKKPETTNEIQSSVIGTKKSYSEATRQKYDSSSSFGGQLPVGVETLDDDDMPNQYSEAVNPTNIELISRQENNQNQVKSGRLIAPPFGTSGPNPLLQPQEISKLPPVEVSENVIHVMGKKPFDIPIRDKYPGMTNGLPNGVETKDITNILYKFKYTVGFHGHYERGLKNGTKIGGYFVNGRDGISRIVTYVADENGYRPKFKFVNLGLDSSDTPNEKTEKTFGLKDFEFVWYPVQ